MMMSLGHGALIANCHRRVKPLEETLYKQKEMLVPAEGHLETAHLAEKEWLFLVNQHSASAVNE